MDSYGRILDPALAALAARQLSGVDASVTVAYRLSDREAAYIVMVSNSGRVDEASKFHALAVVARQPGGGLSWNVVLGKDRQPAYIEEFKSAFYHEGQLVIRGSSFENGECWLTDVVRGGGGWVVAEARGADRALPLSTWKEQVSDKVHIFYYPWYGEEPGCMNHWQQGERDSRRGDIDIASNFYPTLRAYASTDPAVVQQHMKWIREAGVGVISLEWWREEEESCGKRRTPLVLNEAQRAGLKVSFHLAYIKVAGKPSYVPDHPQKVVRDVKYINETYGSYPAFYRNRELGNRPVFYVFESPLWQGDWSALDAVSGDNIILAQTTTPQLTTHFSGAYTYDVGPVCPSASTGHWKAIIEHCRKTGLVWVPSVGPGYIDRRAVPGSAAKIVDRQGGQAYDCQWEQALLSEPTWITVTSFNEWHEGSQIEPATNSPPDGFGYLTYRGAYGRSDATAERAYLDRTRYHAERFDASMSVVGGPPKRSFAAVTVVGVQDGDTLFLRDAAKAKLRQLRLIGVDTPELNPNPKAPQKDEQQWCTRSEDVPFMAREAAEFVKRWLEYPREEQPVEVTVETPTTGTQTDALNRLLGYVYRRGQAGDVGQSLSGALLRRGYSQVFRQDYGAPEPFDNISADQASILRDLEASARAAKRGFWGAYKPSTPSPWPGLLQEHGARCASQPSTVPAQQRPPAAVVVGSLVQPILGALPDGATRVVPIAAYTDGRYQDLSLGPVRERLETVRRILSPARHYDLFVDNRTTGHFTVESVSVGLGFSCEEALVALGRVDGGAAGGEPKTLALSPPSLHRAPCLPVPIEQTITRQVVDLLQRQFLRGPRSERLARAVGGLRFLPDTLTVDALNAYDLHTHSEADLIVAQASMKLERAVDFEVIGNCDPGSLMVIERQAGGLKVLLASEIDCQAPSVVAVGDIDGDGDVEILLTAGQGEAFHWEIYRLVGGRLLKVYSGTDFGC